ncbi:hypothetical protein MRP26_01545 [Bacillus sp. CCB-MMP212]|uniref:hypothetical protein n=1 Tax=Bacillus sp. CCB-MMP212 TaxID=2928002 RepID=UPI001F614B20|nr:hypothetical protein [Bacillus sp. CCB-MMP212]MCI4247643.1 hypothetical protein [Bacillus sp. CCB-MMP212]
MVRLEDRFNSLLQEEDKKHERRAKELSELESKIDKYHNDLKEIKEIDEIRCKMNNGYLKKLGFPPDNKWDVVKSYLYIYGGMFLLAGAVWFGGAILFAAVVVLYELAIGV